MPVDTARGVGYNGGVLARHVRRFLCGGSVPPFRAQLSQLDTGVANKGRRMTRTSPVLLGHGARGGHAALFVFGSLEAT